MNIDFPFPPGALGAERRFLEELLQKIEYCNLSLVDISSDIKQFSVDISTIFPNAPFDVQIRIKEDAVILFYGNGLFVSSIYFMAPEAIEAFNVLFDNKRNDDYDNRIYFLAENFFE